MKLERADRVRRRPEVIRYFFLAVSKTGKVHTGTTYARLATIEKEYGIELLYLADVGSGVVKLVTVNIEDFLLEWRANYNNEDWSYSAFALRRERKTL